MTFLYRKGCMKFIYCLTSLFNNSAGRSWNEIDYIEPRSQVIAQTIVFAFLQKQRRPLWKYFLLPTIITNNQGFKIFFYDPESDILLESRDLFFLKCNWINWIP